jgi:hypothetical protein
LLWIMGHWERGGRRQEAGGSRQKFLIFNF